MGDFDESLLDSSDEDDRQRGDAQTKTQGDAQANVQEDVEQDTRQDIQQDSRQARGEDHEDGNADDRQKDAQHYTQPERQKERQQDYEERVQEQDQQSNNQNSPQDGSGPANVSTNIEGSMRTPTPNPIRESQQQNTAATTSLDTTYQRAEHVQLARALRRPAPSDEQSPLLALQQQVKNCFKLGTRPAKCLGAALFTAAGKNSTTVSRPPHDKFKYGPTSACAIASTTVGVLACPAHRLDEVVVFEYVSLMSFDAVVSKTPSASLGTAFKNAKSRACGDTGACALIMVSLVDVHMFELVKQGKHGTYSTFAHSFALGVGPQGAIVWQGWDSEEDGYWLDKWIDNGKARVRDWQEAGEFVDTFEKFVAYKVSCFCKSFTWTDGCTNIRTREIGTPNATRYSSDASMSTSSRSVALRDVSNRWFLRYSLG